MSEPSSLEQTRQSGVAPGRGLVSDRQSGRRVHAARFDPPPALADALELFWVGAWDLPAEAPHETELLSDPSMHIVFERGEPPRVVGVWTRLWTRTLAGRGRVRAAKLHPGAASAFFSVSAASLADRMTPLTGHLAVPSTLSAAVLDDEDDDVGLTALAGWLKGVRRPLSPRAQEAVAIVTRCRDTPELTSVEQLAADVGLNLRALQRLFAEHVGASPKWLLRRFRLQEAAARVEAGAVLTDLAYALGYADQAHLARDFKAATGKTLTALRRDRPPER